MLLAAGLADPAVEIVGGADIDPAIVGQDLGLLSGGSPIGLAAEADARTLLSRCEVAIDFTVPAATAHHARIGAELGCALVIGTTGLDPTQTQILTEAGRTIPIVWSANMSLGVTVLLGLVEQVARALGPDWDIEISETHHRRKIDAPSGTALALGHAAAAGRGVALADVSVKGRDGMTGPRQEGTIGFASLRGGDVIGDHTVLFAGDGERIEISHKASGRTIYAKGALRAASWTAGRGPGLYGMVDVLGLGR